MRTAIAFVITENKLAIMYRRFGTTSRTHPKGSINFGTVPFKMGKKIWVSHLNLGPSGLFRNFVKIKHYSLRNSAEKHIYQLLESLVINK
jgi:hypothetical protein